MKNKKVIVVCFVLLSIIAFNTHYPHFFLGGVTSQNDKVNLKSADITFEWDYETHTGGGVYQGVFHTDISSNGSYIAVGTGYSFVYLFHKSSDSPLWYYQEPYMGNSVVGISISSDGQYIAAGFSSGNIYAFHRSSNIPLWTYGVSGGISSVFITSDGKYVVARSYDKVHTLNTSNTADPLLWKYQASDAVGALALSDDSQYFATGIGSNVSIFDLSISKPIKNYTTTATINDVAISSDGMYIAAGSDSRKMLLFDRTSDTPLLNYTCNKKVLDVEISAAGDYMTALTYTLDGKVYLFNRSTSLWESTITGWIWGSLSISADGQYIIAGGDGYLHIFHKSRPTPFWSYEILGPSTSAAPYASAISDNNKYIVCGDLNRYVTLIFNNPPTLITDAEEPDTDGTFNLFWDSPLNTDNFSIYMHNSYISEINSSITLKAEEITDYSYLFSNQPYGEYYFVVVAHNETSDIISNCINIVVEVPPQSIWLSSTADPLDGDGCFYINWTESPGADSYIVYVHDSKITEINSSVTVRASGLVNLSYYISGLDSGDYYYVVAAKNPIGKTLSNCIKISVLHPPTLFTLYCDADNPDIDGNFSLTWSKSLDADNYSVYVSNSVINDLFNAELLSQGLTERVYQISNMSDGQYYFAAVAYNLNGESVSNYVNVTVELPASPDDEGDNDNPPSVTGYNHWILLGSLSIGMVIILIKVVKKKRYP